MKSVVVGSCESETAAEALASGFSSRAASGGQKGFTVKGLRSGYESKVKGKKSIGHKYGNDIEVPSGPKYMIVEKGKPTEPFFYEGYEGETIYHGNYYPPEGGAEDMVPSVSGEDLTSFMSSGEWRGSSGLVREFTAFY